MYRHRPSHPTTLLILLTISSPLIAGNTFTLENDFLSITCQAGASGLRMVRVEDRRSHQVFDTIGEAFTLTLQGDRHVRASELAFVAPPQVQRLPGNVPGQRFSASLAAPGEDLQIEWQAILHDDAHYVRLMLTLQSTTTPTPIEAITLIDLNCDQAEVLGVVKGSPVVTPSMFFAYEHPNATSLVATDGPGKRITCSLARHMPLMPGQPLQQSSVIGVFASGQLRRAFAQYIERERPRPYKPFLHYNSWYDIAWGDRKMNEAQCLDVIEAFGRELTDKRGVALDSFVFDDGWDDNKTLWGFHEGFPNGFTPLVPASAKYNSAVGVWLSPWGGYGQAKDERMKYGQTQGFETNANGFSLAGPKYYMRFRDVCAEMMRKYDVNYFKYDGVGIGNDRDGADEKFLPDIEGLLRLCTELREIRPDVYLSITTGTWPSPYWLFYGDSIWRNGLDCGFHGAGTMRQQWVTYRDMITYRMIVKRAPLYPLNSLMVQGICYAQLGTATRMGNDLDDIVDEIWMLFGSGTQLQELYVTPKMMTPPMWDALAKAATWSRENADVLVDVHWIGGDPGQGQPYGYASWSPRKGILVLRNPSEQRGRLAVDVKKAFELPSGAATRYRAGQIILQADQPYTFELEPFEARVLEALPMN